MTKSFTLFSVFGLLVLPVVGMAQDAEPEMCHYLTNSGALQTSYEQVGAAACASLCSDTDTCTAWQYTPHNFNPATAPGECLIYAEASDMEAHDRLQCGAVE